MLACQLAKEHGGALRCPTAVLWVPGGSTSAPAAGQPPRRTRSPQNPLLVAPRGEAVAPAVSQTLHHLANPAASKEGERDAQRPLSGGQTFLAQGPRHGPRLPVRMANR